MCSWPLFTSVVPAPLGSGLSLRIIRQYDVTLDRFPAQIFYGSKTVQPVPSSTIVENGEDTSGGAIPPADAQRKEGSHG